MYQHGDHITVEFPHGRDLLVVDEALDDGKLAVRFSGCDDVFVIAESLAEPADELDRRMREAADRAFRRI